MTVFKLFFPDDACAGEFGVRVITGGETGFERAREVLAGLPRK